MFKFNILNTPKPYDLYLCRPNGDIICYLNGADEDTASIKLNLNNQYELNFDYFRYISCNGKEIMSNGFESLAYGMKILVDRIGYFKMDYPAGNFDGGKDKKTITAYSVDSELEDKDLVSFKINTGEKDSLEYLVTYTSDETEPLINEYTGLPYDYIVFYNTFPEQLKSLLNKYRNNITIADTTSISEIVNYCKLIPRLKSKIITSSDGSMSLKEYVSYTYNDNGDKITKIQLSDDFNSRISELITFYSKYRNQLSLISLAIEKCNCNWSVGEIDDSLVNKKFQFDIDNTNIYAFLTQDVAQATKCIVSFDIVRKKINVIKIDNIGTDSNVILSRKNVINTLDISCNENSIATRCSVSGGNDIDIRYVNFGSERIDDLSYFLNACDENGNLVYMSEELAEKYKQFVTDRNLAREKYVEYTKGYNQSLSSIDEIKYRVPNDGVQNDWDTFTNKELDAALTSYNNLLVTLISLYKEDFGSAGCNSDGSVNESYLKNTIYWYDYYAYNTIIEQISATITARSNNSSYAEIDDEEVLKKINAWKTEWTLFGTVELQNKINAYNNNLSVLVDGKAIILKENSDEAKTWDELSSDEKAEYGNAELNYQYETYAQNYNERNSCQEYLNTLMEKLNSLEEERDSFQAKRTAIVKLVSVEGYDRSELEKLVTLPPSSISGSFSDSELKTINVLYIDKTYSNNNILTTSLDTVVSEIDTQYELLHDAEEQLSIDSQPQITFQTDIDNLLCMPEFKDYDFTVGNYVVLEYYEGYYVKLRLSSITFNPLVPTSAITVSFTNYTKSRSERSDLSDILSLATGGSSGSSSGSGGSGSDSFGDSDKIDVTISNTMLAKLLNTEMFGTRVSNIILDTIQVNKLTSKLATFGGLANGSTVINGKCLQTGYIVDSHYNGTDGKIDNTVGSIINLETGLFKMAGGVFEWNGTSLKVDGDLTAQTLSAGGKLSEDSESNGLFVDKSGNLFAGKNNETKIFSDGTFSFGNESLKWDGTLLKVEGDLIAKTLSAGGKLSADSESNGLFIDKDGNLFAGKSNEVQIFSDGRFSLGNGNLEWNGNNLVATGTIYAKAGSFGKTNPFNISDNGLDGSASSSSHTDTIYESQNISLYDSGNATYSSTFQIQVSQTGKNDTLNDICMSLNSLDIMIGFAYDVTTKVTDSSTSDSSGSESGGDDGDGSESGGSGDSSSTTTTTTTVTTHYTGFVSVQLISDASDISNQVAISTDNESKIYTYTYTLTSGDILSYLKNLCKNNDDTISVSVDKLSITGASVIPNYSYYFTSYTLVSHIGTDCLSYSNTLTVKDGAVTLGSTTIKSQLTLLNNLSLSGQNAAIYGYMAANDGWRILGGGSNDTGYLEIATQDNGDEAIYVRQYNGNFSSLKRTLTLLDGSGNTTIPGILKVRQLQTTASFIDMDSRVVFKASDTYFGYSSQTNERRLRFMGTSSGSYRHDTYIYGGNTGSTTAIGIYDNINSRGVLCYNDRDNVLSVAGVGRFCFRDYSGTTRTPIASTHANGKRIAHIGSKSTGLAVYGQWGTANAKFTGKTVKFDSSDIRLKENIADCEINSALDIISKLKLHSFDWKEYDADLPRHQKIGFIADEIEQIDSKFSFGGGYDEDGIMNVKGVDTFYMMGYVIKAIQELKAENDRLKKIIGTNA